ATRMKDTELLKKLSELDVRSIELGVVPHRMMFDQPQLIVGRGQPIEIRFENTDAMPHNFVLVRPGALARVGAVSEATGRDRDAIERNYVPVSEDVLAAGTLLQSGESEAIYFTAPQEPGVYPFVCTYPGHWRRMFGALVVVDELTAYETSPDSYLSEHGPQPQDELLMQRRASHAWTYDELVADLKQLETGRSFVAGKSLFRSASCIGCHNLGGEGQVFGPDLKELTPQRQAVEHILRSVVEPSANIDDQYRSQTFYLDSGKVVTGMVVDQTSDYVKLVVGPMGVGELCDDTAIFVQRAEIEERVDSKQSLMPAGLLDQLTREEILDLLAFVLAEGDPEHALFRSP
ncbi:MAG: plastocyanin/azurin family copper-binding protein, partial [Planctomycetota bacterium]